MGYARGKLQHDDQRDAFKNANSASHSKFFPVTGNSRNQNIYQQSISENQFHQNTDEMQIQKYTPQFHPLITRASAINPPFILPSLITSSPEFGAWLQESLTELSECPSCALEDEMDEPTDIALDKAKNLLEKIAKHVIDQPDVYPMQDSSIAIDFRSPNGKNGVLFLVERDGSGVLFYRTSNSKGRIRVDDATDLIKEGGIRVLKRVGIR